MSKIDRTEAERQFIAAMADRGLKLSRPLLADGKIHRCDAMNKDAEHGKGDGSYLLHLDEIPAGGFINWTDGLDWQNWHYDVGRPRTEAEVQETRRAMAAARAEAKAEEKRRRESARRRACRMWDNAQPASADHPYLTEKQVKPHGLRETEPWLLVPMYNPDHELCSLQLIDRAGEKRYLEGGRAAGCYCRIGKASTTAPIIICEGYATGASIHEAAGYCVFVAFNAGNLKVVAKMVREQLARFVRHEHLHSFEKTRDRSRGPGRTGRGLREITSSCRLDAPYALRLHASARRQIEHAARGFLVAANQRMLR